MGIGHGINQRELRQIAMNDDQYVIQVDDFDALKDKLQMILDESCQGKLVHSHLKTNLEIVATTGFRFAFPWLPKDWRSNPCMLIIRKFMDFSIFHFLS